MQNLERNELVYKTETDSENELMVVRREECREGIVKEFGIDTYSLLYLKWINKDLLKKKNKDLLYSTGNSARCYMYGGLAGRGVWERMDPCICMAESLHCSPETITKIVNQLYSYTK